MPNKHCGQLITISPHSLTMLKTANAEFQSIYVWFTDQNNRPLEIEDSVNITLINTINSSRHEQVCLIRLRFERYVSHHRAT